MERIFKKGDIVKHFKRETIPEEELKKEPNLYVYEIIGTAKHTETGEKVIVYKPLYSSEYTENVEYLARPYEMFMCEVDHQKYPEIKQKYRFVLRDEK